VGTATIEDLEHATHVMLIGTNPRLESPVLNARIRKAWQRGAQVGLVGEPVDLTYDYYHYGSDRAALARLDKEGVDDVLEKPTVVVLGQAALRGEDGAAVLARAMAFAERSRSGFMVLHDAASRVAAMDLGFATEGGLDAALDGADAIYALGVDEIDLPEGPFVIYQGSHGDRGAHRADVILPAAAWTEEGGIFVNTEGRPQMANRAGFPPGDARENWAILRALSAALGATLPFDSLAALRAAMFEAVPHLAAIDQVPENDWSPVPPGELGDGDFAAAARDHYLINPVARASEVMGELARLASSRTQPLAAE
jgi:NADH-quinone oxidoreductase subunit G